MKRFLLATVAWGLASAPAMAAQLPPLVIIAGKVQNIPAGDTLTPGSIPAGSATGVVCDGSTNITTPLQAAVNAIEAKGGGTITLPAGVCLTSSTITVNASGVHIIGQGQTATLMSPASGSFNIFTFTGTSSVQDGGVERLSFNMTNMSGGNAISVNGYNRTLFRDISSFGTNTFLVNQSANAMLADNVNVFSIRGAYCFELLAPGSARSDVMDFTNVTCGGASGSTYTGLIVNGFVNTVDIHHFGVSGPDGGGALIENTNSGTLPPQFFFAHDFQVEAATGDGFHITAASSVYCANCYSSSNTGDGLYIGVAASDVNFVNPQMELNGKYGIATYAFGGGTGTTGTYITGGNVSTNGQGSPGTYSEMLVGSTAVNVTATGVNMAGSQAAYGVTVQAGATYVSLNGNTYLSASVGSVHDLSGAATLNGGFGANGLAIGPSVIDAGASGTKQLLLANSGTAGTTISQVEVATGTANAYASLSQADGSTPVATLASGPADTGGIQIVTAAGGIKLQPAPASSVAVVQAINPGVTNSSQTQIVAATGTANAYTLMANLDGSTPSGVVGTGPADAGGLAITTQAGPIILNPAAGSVTQIDTGLKLAAITGSTQCLQVSTTGAVSGSGSPCLTGGSAVTSFNTRVGAVTLLNTDISGAGGLLAANNFSDVASTTTAKTNLGLVAVASSGSATDLTAGVLAAARGGAGTITGALKGSGAGVVTQAACADLSNGATGCSSATGTSGHTLGFLDGANTHSGVQSFLDGDLSLTGSSSGATVLHAPATGGGAMTFPAGTDTIVTLAATQTLTNKSISSGQITGLGSAASASTGTSGHTLPYLDGGNTWGGPNSFSGWTAFIGAAAPVVSACGSNTLDANANDRSGTINVTGGVPASCTITFSTPPTVYAHCRVVPQTALAAFAYTYTRLAITITATALSGKIDYFCDGGL